MPVVQFQPFTSLVQPEFWHELTRRKVDELRLSQDALPIHASYALARTARDRESGVDIAVPANFVLGGDAFKEAHKRDFKGDFVEARELLYAARETVQRGDPVCTPEIFLDAEGGILETMRQALHALGRDDEAAVCACTAAVVGRRLNNNVGLVKSLVLLAETVDDECAERLLDALVLPLHRMGLFIDTARALAHTAALANRRGMWELARRRARRALVLFGDVKTDWRPEKTAEIAAANRDTTFVTEKEQQG